MSRRRQRWVLIGAGVTTLVLVAHWPVTTRVGVNYQGSSRRMPLYEKAINFISRDLQTRRIAQDITAGASGEDDRLVKIAAWVTAHIHAVPSSLPVVDDHPLHILIRGYGAEDQRAEAFALLAGYSGFRASVAKLRPPGAATPVMMGLVQAGHRTLAFDVIHEVIFRNERGALADVQELLRNPALVTSAAHGLVIDGLPYEQYVMELRHSGSGFSRNEAQQPWQRLRQELARLTGRP